MIPIFDLDDTLYPERSFVESGFLAVALDLEQNFGWPADKSFAQMVAILESAGRGAIFNQLLSLHGAMTASLVRHCVRVYRLHQPKIHLAPAAIRCLKKLGQLPYLVTDGHKIVQYNKVKALEIEEKFKKIYITHRYGIRHAKPSTYCFELIRRREECTWSEMYYVGDNPAKDFVNLNKLGVHTIRVRTGEYANVVAKEGFEAKYIIDTLDDLVTIIGSALMHRTEENQTTPLRNPLRVAPGPL
jgi:putative hydrolase of the HAD superfamily